MSGGRQKTALEYLLADRGMPILPVSFSLMASFMSAISIMGLTREIYMFGTQFLGVIQIKTRQNYETKGNFLLFFSYKHQLLFGDTHYHIHLLTSIF